ncbi:hypothetical protein QBC40DRAFT_266928 [Triangularia verruculosa]|uniref:Uncharacterized protein n=1 Tax=Triangularia verruculosa TaxID=2587418 RepID=A0AAN6XDQ9_9PEZI|nr:hypothetical protein QBC40DRAFT_266928 [Triangularia verruculosa]
MKSVIALVTLLVAVNAHVISLSQKGQSDQLQERNSHSGRSDNGEAQQQQQRRSHQSLVNEQAQQVQQPRSHKSLVNVPTVDNTIVRGEWAVSDDSNTPLKSGQDSQVKTGERLLNSGGKQFGGNTLSTDAMDLRSGWTSTEDKVVVDSHWLPSGPGSLDLDKVKSDQEAVL